MTVHSGLHGPIYTRIGDIKKLESLAKSRGKIGLLTTAVSGRSAVVTRTGRCMRPLATSN